MGEDKNSFLTSLPGILSGLAAVLTAGAGVYVLVNKTREQPAVTVKVPVAQASEAAITEPVTEPAEAALVAPSPVATSTAEGAPFSAPAVIDDPDGYVNVRANANAQSRIVAVVRLNEPIRTHPQAAGWWLVRTRDGTQGYIHASRIRMLED